MLRDVLLWRGQLAGGHLVPAARPVASAGALQVVLYL
jgi:hypothetical protein